MGPELLFPSRTGFPGHSDVEEEIDYTKKGKVFQSRTGFPGHFNSMPLL